MSYTGFLHQIMEPRWGVGDTGDKGSAASSGEVVGGHPQLPQIGDGGSVGGAAPNIQSMRKVEKLIGGGCRRYSWRCQKVPET